MFSINEEQLSLKYKDVRNDLSVCVLNLELVSKRVKIEPFSELRCQESFLLMLHRTKNFRVLK